MKLMPMHQIMTLEYVTTEKAEEWLSNLGPQRIRRPNVTKRYERDMSLGFWKLTHQAIAFTDDNRLVDGQHRLEAIIQSGSPQWMWVCRGISRDELIAIDQHAKRSVSDAITIQRGEFIDKTAVAIANALLFASEGVPWRRSLSASETWIVISEHEDAIGFSMKQFVTKTRGVSTASVMAAVALAFYEEDKGYLKSFCDVLCSGMPTDAIRDRPVLLLRRALIEDDRYRRNDMPSRRDACRITQRAILSFCKKDGISKLLLPEKPIYRLPGIERLLERLGGMRLDGLSVANATKNMPTADILE